MQKLFFYFRLAASDDEIMEKLKQRFVELDVKDILHFDQLQIKVQIQLLQSTMKSVGEKRKYNELQNENQPSKVAKIEL